VGETTHLTRAAEKLIAEHIESVGVLDLLLLLHGGRDRAWSSAELCHALRCPEGWIEPQLAALMALDLLTEVQADQFKFRRGRRFGSAVDEIARVCRRDRQVVTRRIFARPPSAVRRLTG
jgi:hypothetical protein